MKALLRSSASLHKCLRICSARTSLLNIILKLKAETQDYTITYHHLYREQIPEQLGLRNLLPCATSQPYAAPQLGVTGETTKWGLLHPSSMLPGFVWHKRKMSHNSVLSQVINLWREWNLLSPGQGLPWLEGPELRRCALRMTKPGGPPHSL